MDQEASLGRRAHSPVRAVVVESRGARKEAGAGVRNALDIIELPDDAGGFTGGTRTFRNLRCAAVRSARFREIGREALLVHLHDLVRGTILRETAADDLH